MNTNKAMFVKTHPSVPTPKRATNGSAGYDVTAIHDIFIEAGSRTRAPLGISITPPKNCYIRLAGRSGLNFKHGLAADGGVIDPDYTGEIHILLYNHGNQDVTLEKGDCIGQIIFEQFQTPELTQVEILESTDRSDSGYGSTGGMPS